MRVIEGWRDYRLEAASIAVKKQNTPCILGRLGGKGGLRKVGGWKSDLYE